MEFSNKEYITVAEATEITGLKESTLRDTANKQESFVSEEWHIAEMISFSIGKYEVTLMTLTEDQGKQLHKGY